MLFYHRKKITQLCIFFIVYLFLFGCGDRENGFYEVDFYGNGIKIPEFLKHNKDKERLKYYCENNLYLKDSLGATFFDARLCRNRHMDFDFNFDFEHLKAVVEGASIQIKQEIPEMKILSVNSTNKGNYFLYEITLNHDNQYSKITYIAFESHFIYIYHETDIGNTDVMKRLDKTTRQFERKKLMKNIVLPENTDTCNYCHNILFQ